MHSKPPVLHVLLSRVDFTIVIGSTQHILDIILVCLLLM
jgi:hypothetical protein